MKFRTVFLALAMTTVFSGCKQNLAVAGTEKMAASEPKAEATKPAAKAEVGKDVPADVTKAITSNLETRYADQKLKIQSVSSTPIAGLYEIVANGKQIAYTDATGNYMLVGDLIETKEGRSLTEERKAVLNAIDYSALPFQYAIKEVRGNGKLQVAVFSDPDCPLCKRLEHEFAQMTDVTIYNFMMPITSLHPDSERKAVQIMCQPNPTQAWVAWMREGKMPPKVAECNNHHVQETMELGEGFGFNGTPTLVFPNGRTQSGYLPTEQLVEVLKANQK